MTLRQQLFLNPNLKAQFIVVPEFIDRNFLYAIPPPHCHPRLVRGSKSASYDENRVIVTAGQPLWMPEQVRRDGKGIVIFSNDYISEPIMADHNV